MAKKTTKKAAPKKSAAKATAANKARTKSEVYGIIADETGLSKKQVGSVFESMSSIISKDLKKSGPGVFAVPGLMKLKAVYKPATKQATKPDPFNPGKMMTVKAKPARTVVRIRPLKALKDSI